MTRLISRIAIATVVLALAVGSVVAQELSGPISEIFFAQARGSNMAVLGTAGQPLEGSQFGNGVSVAFYPKQDNAQITDATFDYAGIMTGYSPSEMIPATFKDFSFKEDITTWCMDPIYDLWKAFDNGAVPYEWHFDLLEWSESESVLEANVFQLVGYGNVYTPDGVLENVRFSLSTQSAAEGLNRYSWSAQLNSPTAATVPEPTTLVLLGTGLLGAAVVARRRISKK